jgi:YD repeat-containing protein
MWYGANTNKCYKKILIGLNLLLFAMVTRASDYRDLNYQVFLSNSTPYTVYLNPFPKQLELHMQSGMPEVPLQQYPLEPTSSASIPDAYTSVSPLFTSVDAIDASTLASDYTQQTKMVFGDWNSDGRRDIVALGPRLQIPGSSPATYYYLLLDVINGRDNSTPPTLNSIPVAESSELGSLLEQWANGTMIPDAFDLTGTGYPQSLEFVSTTLDASGNPFIMNVTPDGYGDFNTTTATVQTGDDSDPADLADVNGPDPAQIMPRDIGATGGSHTVALDGSANYQIPISVPAATGNVQPTLSLNYSSNAGNSNMGFGWSLSGQSKISRCGKSLKQDGVVSGVTFTNTDQFCLDGQRLILMSGTHGTTGATYRLENEIFAKVTVASVGSDGMPQTFTVNMPDGSTSTYGGTSDSQIGANGVNAGKILEWALSQMKDRYTNYSDYHYMQVVSNGSYIIREIDYGGNSAANKAHPYKVTFDYTANPIGYQGYLDGSTMSSPQLLQQVSVYDGPKELRFYALRYQPAQQHGEAYLLESVTECSGNGYCLSPTKFTWADAGTPSFATPVASIHTLTATDGPTQETFADMNGDGLPDRVVLLNTGELTKKVMEVQLSTGSGFPTPVIWSNSIGFNINSSTSTSNVYAVQYEGEGLCYDMEVASAGNCLIGSFVDVNGDGLPDYVYLPPTVQGAGSNVIVTQGTTIYVALNTGSSLQAPTAWLNAPISDGKFQVADVNGDGLADVVFLDTSGNIQVALSTGTGFATTSAAWLSSGGSVTNSPDSTTPRDTLVDVNGDGLPDKVWVPNGTSDVYVALNTGANFSTPTIWLNHTTLGYSILSTDVAWEGYADMNGDGMADRYWVYDYGDGPELMVALSDGTKFLTPYVWFYDTVVDARPQAGQGLTFADVNDDGLVDMLWVPNTMTDKVEVALQSAGGFGRPMPWLSGITPSTTIRQAFVDVNGDGLLDFTWYPSINSNSMNIALSQGKPMSELKTITNGFGHQTTFTYDSMTNTGDPAHPVYTKGDSGSYPNSSGQVYLQGARRVVSHVDVSNGIGGLARSTYHYTGLKQDTKTRQNLGFAQISVLNEVTGLQDTTFYSQSLANYTQGMITETKTVDTSTGNALSDTNNTWQVNVLHDSADTTQSRYIRQLQTTNISKRDLLNNLLYTESNTYGYDSYGHISSQTTQEYNASSALVKTTTINNTYINNTALWILGLSDTVTVTNDVTGALYGSYDPPALSRTSSWGYDPSTEQLLTETIWTDSSKTTPLNVTTYSNYDNFGHAKTTTLSGPGFANRSSLVNYDGSGRHVTSAKNPLNQWVSSTYYNNSSISNGSYPELLQTSTDLNGIVTRYTYDGFGRPATTTVADGTSSAITTTSAFVDCDTLASDCDAIHATYAITSTTTGGTTSATFYDQLGRVVRKSGQILDGSTVYVDYVFDAAGNNTQASEPYEAGATLVWNTMGYDKLGRVTSSTQPSPGGGTRTDTVSYSGYTTTTTVDTTGSPQHHTETKNALGQLASATDDSGKTLTYLYDSNNDLVNTIDSKGNSITLVYDGVGRKIAMNDPDKGYWTYTYNGLGQLITQTNAVPATSCMVYDLLGRMTNRVEFYGSNASDALDSCANPGTNAQIANWTYDTATHGKGKLAGESLGSGYPANEYSQTYSYDSLSRVQSTTKTIQNQTYTYSTTYDSLSRPSVLTYPAPAGSTPVSIQYNYNSLGFLSSISDTATSVVYYSADTMDARGNITHEIFGNGVTTTHSYDSNSGTLSDISTTKGSTNL